MKAKKSLRLLTKLRNVATHIGGYLFINAVNVNKLG